MFELDELFHFVERASRSKNKEPIYLMTMISRNPRQIVGFMVVRSREAQDITKIVQSVPPAEYYCTDGFNGYCDTDFGKGVHIRNTKNKNDTHIVESINADLRTYIAGIQRKSRCFFRTIETLTAVLTIFVDAYNKFGEYKLLNRKEVIHKPTSKSKYLHKYRQLPFNHIRFIEYT